MTGVERVVDALLSGDVAELRGLADDAVVGAVARAGLARLAPDDLGPEDLVVLRAVSGHPGLSAAELAALVGPVFGPASARLLERGLVVSSRFERADCRARTARGAQVLARLRRAPAR